MRNLSRLAALALCAALLSLSAVRAESRPASADYLASLNAPAGEKVIPPQYAVPDYVVQLIEVARGEIGYVEEKNGLTKYGTWAGYPMAEWCAEFQCWCVSRVDQKYGTHLLNRVYPNYSGTNVGRNWFIDQGRYVARSGNLPGYGAQWWKGADQAIPANGYIPQPGDWMFLSDNASYDTSHVALVEYCAYDEEGRVRVHVIEGNNVLKPAPQGVERNDYALDSWRILGYGTVYDLADWTLKFGHSGPKVKELQQELVQAGLLEERYTTGKFGAITQDCIKAVQRQYGILETGIANLETRVALRKMAAQMRTVVPAP